MLQPRNEHEWAEHIDFETQGEILSCFVQRIFTSSFTELFLLHSVKSMS